MERLVVNGGKILKGKLKVPVAKNAALPIIAATLLADGESEIKNCPNLLDIKTSADIISSLGAAAMFNDEVFAVCYRDSGICEISKELCKKMRSSILYLAPLLYRRGRAVLCYPGGCNLGKRQIDIHLDGLCAMGAKVSCDGEKIVVTAEKRLKGTRFRLKLPSVGATQTLLMAAAVADGITILHNCAREPEVVDLARYLNCAGARITGAGKSEIIIHGVECLNGVEYTPIADRIFAATVLSAVNACKGFCVLENYPLEYMHTFEQLLKKSGLKVLHFSDSALVYKLYDTACDIKIHTGYYPAFSTDMGPLLSAAMVENNGTLALYEGVFENRFSYKEQFSKLGLYCRVKDREYYQTKQKDIYKANLAASDLRAGAALVVAALAKRGCFTIEGLSYIDRGYENIEKVFAKLGADIRRETFEQ